MILMVLIKIHNNPHHLIKRGRTVHEVSHSLIRDYFVTGQHLSSLTLKF